MSRHSPARKAKDQERNMPASGQTPWEKKPTQFKPVGEEDRHYRRWVDETRFPEVTYEEQPKADGDMILTMGSIEYARNDMGRV